MRHNGVWHASAGGSVAYHADMQMFHLDKGRTFVLRGEEALKKQLTDIGYQVAETAMTPEPKPKDVLCNMLNLNGTVLANLGVMDPNIYTCLKTPALKWGMSARLRCATTYLWRKTRSSRWTSAFAHWRSFKHRRAACAQKKTFSGWLRLRLLRRLLWPDRQKCGGVHRQARFFRVRGGDSCVSRKALRTVHWADAKPDDRHRRHFTADGTWCIILNSIRLCIHVQAPKHAHFQNRFARKHTKEFESKKS